MAAYLISRVMVHDAGAMPAYIAGSVALATTFGAHYLARTEEVEAVEGTFGGGRIVLVEFPSMHALRSFWDSPEYQELRKLRLEASEGDVWILPGEDEAAAKA